MGFHEVDMMENPTQQNIARRHSIVSPMIECCMAPGISEKEYCGFGIWDNKLDFFSVFLVVIKKILSH